MALTGNHGRIIPRDKNLLHNLYWVDGMTLPEMGMMFGVTHKSVERVMRELNIPRRGLGVRPAEFCIDCLIVRPKKLSHKLAKNGTGTRCHECLKKYKKEWQRKASNKGTKRRSREEVRAKRKADLKRWYLFGPKQPKGESQWISKAKALLRTNRRILSKMTSHGVSQFQSAESELEPTSQTSCRH